MTKNPYSELLQELSRRGIGYVLLRDHPEAGGIRDLDLLIDAERLADFLSCCRSHQFRLIKDGRLNPGKIVLLHWRDVEPRILDVHFQLIYRGLEYLDAKQVLSRKQHEGGYYFLSPEDELLTLFFHNLLGKGEIQSKHRGRLEELLRKPLDESYLHQHLRQYRLEGVFTKARQEFIELANDSSRVRKLRRAALSALRYHPINNATRRLQMSTRTVFSKWLGRRRGALIAFLGPDGCGKSSITNALRDTFRQATLTTDIVYLGPWGGSKLPLHDLVSALNFKPYSPDEKASFRGGAATTKPAGIFSRARYFFSGLIFYLALAIELWFRYWFFVAPKLRQGRIVLADRFIYDILIGYKNRPVRRFQRLRMWLCRHYPTPDLTILLDASAEVIHRRKPQFEEHQLIEIRRRYQELRAQFDLKVLDTSISLEKTMREFMEEHVEMILEGMERRL